MIFYLMLLLQYTCSICTSIHVYYTEYIIIAVSSVRNSVFSVVWSQIKNNSDSKNTSIART